jgi:predicted phosphate transport protein (TIGR00153 family)
MPATPPRPEIGAAAQAARGGAPVSVLSATPTGDPVPDHREPRFWRNLASRMRPRDRRFQPLLQRHAQLGAEAMVALRRLLEDPADPHAMVREIESLEKTADRVVDEVHAALRRSVFPPHPRAAIVGLAGRLDDILDLAEDAAQCIHLYHVTRLTPEALRLAALAQDCVTAIGQAVVLLDQPRRWPALRALCDQVDELEAQADHVLRAAMSKLFREEPDARELIRLRAVYEVLEEISDACKDVAGDLEAIVLGHFTG